MNGSNFPHGTNCIAGQERRSFRALVGRFIVLVAVGLVALQVVRIALALPAVFENREANLRDRQEHAGVGR